MVHRYSSMTLRKGQMMGHREETNRLHSRVVVRVETKKGANHKMRVVECL